MNLTLLFQGITTATSVGMGCGTCCSPGIGAFLTGFMLSHNENVRQSIASFLSFYFGKIMAVVAICMAASMAGRSFIDENGFIGSVDTGLIIDTFMIAVGLVYTVRWIMESKGSCHGCKHHTHEKKNIEGKSSRFGQLIMLFTMGMGYGASPCVPLIMITGYCATLPAQYAIITGGLFTIASAISPMLIVFILSGLAAGKFRKEMPRFLKWFRLITYLLLIVFFMIDFCERLAAI